MAIDEHFAQGFQNWFNIGSVAYQDIREKAGIFQLKPWVSLA
jgi:hypothetical protein